MAINKKSLSNLNRTTHWMSKSRFYRIYSHIHNRCNRKENCNYKNYWWKWIKNEWNKFEEFKTDMYKDYLYLSNIIWEKNVSIDRIDNSKNYCKQNCRWINLKEQQENRNINHYITYNWETHNLRKWSRIIGINEQVLRNRIVVRKWDINKSFTTPVWNNFWNPKGQIFEINWQVGTAKELAIKIWKSKRTIYRIWKKKENQ